MDINKGLLWADNAAPSSNAVTGKVLDFGASVGFDHNNHEWNRIFVAAPACSTCTAAAITVYTAMGYDAKKTYALNASVFHEGKFYYCSTAITTPEAWTAGHWTEGTTKTTSFTFTLTAGQLAKFKLGGAFIVDCPKDLDRYVRADIAFTTASPSKVTIGLVKEIDTDCIALGGGIDWKFYKAKMGDTELVNTPMKNVAEVIANGSTTSVELSAAIGAHAALTTGVHGLT